MSCSDSGAVDGHRHARGPRARERHGEPSELGRERDERCERLEVSLVDDGDVDGRAHDLAVERGDDLLGDDDARAILGLGRRAREVRRDDDLREPEQRAGVRLGLEDVERGPCDLPRPDRLLERRLVHETAARGVHDADAVLHLRERLGVDEAAGLVAERKVQRDDVGFRVDIRRGRGRLDAELAEAVDGDERVVGDDAHAEPEPTPRDLPSDPPESEDAERLAGELDPGEALALPGAGRQRRMRLWDVSREREKERDRVLRRRVDRRLGGVGDDDAASCRRVDVDVVDTHACAADHLQPSRAFDQRGVHPRPGAHDERVEVADDLGQVGVAVLDDVEPALQKLEPRLGDGLADEDARSLWFRHARRRSTPRAREPSPRPARWRRRARREAPRRR